MSISRYNIDALRNADGTYNKARYGIINGALRCGHTAHLQTGRGTVAFRPQNDGWLVEFQPSNGGDRTGIVTDDIREARTFAYQALNGNDCGFEAGDATSYWSNQNEREAEVLAVRDDLVLIEYVMPGTTSGRETSALVVCKAIDGRLTHHRNYSHRRLPRRWVQAMHAQGTTNWLGAGQRESELVPFPEK